MSIRFVDTETEEAKHGWYDVGTQLIFASVKSLNDFKIKTVEIINNTTGEHVAFGIPVVA